MSLRQIAQATEGELRCAPDPEVHATSMTWDSREAVPGCLYVAFPGERVDGHDFADQAAKAGAVCLLVEHPLETDCPQVVVRNTTEALSQLAAAWREGLDAKVVAITGSTGKTTTKALVRDVLSAAGKVVATEANQNNEIGAPRTLLRADADTDYIVVEMGMRGRGQIAKLCAMAKPDWGLVTNIGESHMELLGSQENIVRAKAELLEALPCGGMAFLNAANSQTSWAREISQLDERPVALALFDGEGKPRSSAQCYVWAEEVHLDEGGHPTFQLCASCEAPSLSGFESKDAGEGNLPCQHSQLQGRRPCRLQLQGLHNVSNACSAAAVGLAAGLTLEECASALEAAVPENGRQEMLEARNGAQVINDAYNANPDSMKAALESFKAMAVAGKRIAVLGDMGELGPVEEEAHRRVGALAAKANLDMLVCVGSLARLTAEAAAREAKDGCSIIAVGNLKEAQQAVESAWGPQDAVLLKASHFMGFQKLVEGLVG